LGVEQAIVLNSGTTTLIDPSVGLGIEPTDTIIVPPFSFTATANAV